MDHNIERIQAALDCLKDQIEALAADIERATIEIEEEMRQIE